MKLLCHPEPCEGSQDAKSEHRAQRILRSFARLRGCEEMSRRALRRVMAAREGALHKFSPALCAGKTNVPGFGGREGGHHKIPVRREIFMAAASAAAHPSALQIPAQSAGPGLPSAPPRASEDQLAWRERLQPPSAQVISRGSFDRPQPLPGHRRLRMTVALVVLLVV